MHLVEEDILIDAWAGVVERGNEVVEGLYYRQQGRCLGWSSRERQ
jgi:hypothetical protein